MLRPELQECLEAGIGRWCGAWASPRVRRSRSTIVRSLGIVRRAVSSRRRSSLSFVCSFVPREEFYPRGAANGSLLRPWHVIRISDPLSRRETGARMTVELLIQAIVRQTTILIAQL